MLQTPRVEPFGEDLENGGVDVGEGYGVGGAFDEGVGAEGAAEVA